MTGCSDAQPSSSATWGIKNRKIRVWYGLNIKLDPISKMIIKNTGRDLNQ
jgi:hypothetical protein